MIHYEFKTCISDGMELYGFVQEEANGQRVMSTRNARFPQSLLSFLDFDIEQIRLAFQPLSDGVRKVIAEKSREESDRVCQMFAGLTNYHPYFVLLFLDWRYRLDRAWYLGYEFPQNYLQVEYLDEMPDNLERLQRQALDLLTHIWVKDTSDRSVDEKMTAYYLEAEQVEKDVFRFRPQKMSYELMYRQTFAEFLCPDTVYDLIDYHLRECLKREIKMRRCKNCGRLFAVTGHGGTATAPPMREGAPVERSARSGCGRKARAQTSRSRCFAGSTRSASLGSKPGGLPRTSSTAGAREPERSGTSVMLGGSRWKNLRRG